MIKLANQKLRFVGAGLAFLLAAFSISLPQTDNVSRAIADLTSTDKEVRLQAIITLAGATDDKRSVKHLIEALKDPDDWNRERAADILGFRKEASAASVLIPLLRGKNESVRSATAGSLGNIGDPTAVEPLIEYLANSPKSHGGTCNYAAIQALGKFNDARAAVPLFSYLRKHGCDHEVQKAIGSAGIERMIQYVQTGSYEERETALWVLTGIADERALDALVSALLIEEDNFPINASSTIVHRIGAPAIEPLRIAFAKTGWRGRRNIVVTIARINDERVTAALLEFVTHTEVNVRREAIRTLTEGNLNETSSKNDRIVTVILAAVADSDQEIANLAIRSLATQRREDVYYALIKALHEPTKSAEASIVLGTWKNLQALPYLITVLRGDDPLLAGRASAALVQIGDEAVDDLILVLTDKNKEFPMREIRRRKAQEKTFFFRCGNDEPDPVLDPRVLAANALGFIGDERARIPLTQAIRDKSEWLRFAATAALEQLDKKNRLRVPE